MRGIEVPQAPPRSARPPHRAGAFATFQAIENAGVFGWHKVRSTEVAAPTRRSGTARLISLTPKVHFRPILVARLLGIRSIPRATGSHCKTGPSQPYNAATRNGMS